MNDIPEKLRQAYHNDLTDVPLLLEAADEIEQLELTVSVERGKVEYRNKLLAKTEASLALKEVERVYLPPTVEVPVS